MDVWPLCLQRLEAELPLEDVQTWLRPLQAEHRDQGFVLYAPNPYVLDEVRSRYLPRIRELAAHFGCLGDVNLDIGTMRRAPLVTAGPQASPAMPTARAVEAFQGNLDSHAWGNAQDIEFTDRQG